MIWWLCMYLFLHNSIWFLARYGLLAIFPAIYKETAGAIYVASIANFQLPSHHGLRHTLLHIRGSVQQFHYQVIINKSRPKWRIQWSQNSLRTGLRAFECCNIYDNSFLAGHHCSPADPSPWLLFLHRQMVGIQRGHFFFWNLKIWQGTHNFDNSTLHEEGILYHMIIISCSAPNIHT